MNVNEFPIVLFTTETGEVRVNAVLRDRTLWLTQKTMAGLFGVKSQAITKHLKNIYATKELQMMATCSKMEQVQNEGGRSVSREVVFYNLDAIVAEILEGAGSVSRAQSDEKAFVEYEEFNRHQKIESDFDRQIKLFLDAKDDGDLAK